MATHDRPSVAPGAAAYTPRSDASPDARPAVRTAYSYESGRSYRLDRLIGQGGFGEVYLATPVPAAGFPAQVCVKISDRLSAWLREAYFAELLLREPRALRVFDRFAIVDGSRMRYCLAMEYAEHGDLGAWLELAGPQPERFVRREIAAILRALDALHRGQALHRDLTPFNVFVCKDVQLKLGDFGIATHQFSRRGVTADAFNLFNVPNEIAWGRVRRWQQRDDIYQVGLIAAMLLRGDISSPMRSRDVRALPCSNHLKEVIHRCLGVRGKRYEAAGELIAALRQRPREVRLGRVQSLEGKRVSFTGFLSRPRSEASAAARRAGAVVQSKPGQSTDVLVRGRPNAQQIAGTDGGSKLIEIRRLAAQGHSVTVIGDARFWKLVEPAPPPRTTRGAASVKPRARDGARTAGPASRKSASRPRSTLR
ncbi:MAG TPA: protein kinase [Gemmatimonadaceae bacterium]|nr:protein kinase [Gemmatimonadaceae bacterium]